MGAFAGAFGGDDGVDDVHAGGDFAEDSVAVAIEAGVVEVVVVIDVDEELGGGAVGDVGASHGEGATGVFEAVFGLILDGGVGGFLAHFSVEAAALDHEAWDDPMEDGAGVVTFFGVGNKVGDADGGFFGIEFDFDVPFGGFESDFHGGGFGFGFGSFSGFGFLGLFFLGPRGGGGGEKYSSEGDVEQAMDHGDFWLWFLGWDFPKGTM